MAVASAFGKGIPNMKKRARDIGASLDYPPTNKGVVVRVSLPLAEASATKAKAAVDKAL
jgi:signal transduction histidine kinase